MNFTFSPAENNRSCSDTLTTETVQHNELTIYFDNGTAYLLECDAPYFECVPSDEGLHGHLYAIDGKVVSVRDIFVAANEQYDALKAEYEQDAAEEDAMASELSCPRMTGRV